MSGVQIEDGSIEINLMDVDRCSNEMWSKSKFCHCESVIFFLNFQFTSIVFLATVRAASNNLLCINVELKKL